MVEEGDSWVTTLKVEILCQILKMIRMVEEVLLAREGVVNVSSFWMVVRMVWVG